MSRQVLVSTIDNPFNPFSNFSEWFMFDAIEKQYNSLGIVDRLANYEEGMSQVEEEKAYEEAIDKLINMDPAGIYIKVFSDEEKDRDTDKTS